MPPPGWPPPPPPPPAENPTAHRHDGFYLRMGIGVGYGHIHSSGTLTDTNLGSSTTDQGDFDATYDGAGPAYELLIGGTVARGLVIGGGLVGQDISNPKVRLNTTGNLIVSGSNVTTNGSLGVGALGPFIDWFPDERGGLHFGGMVGLALIGLDNGNGNTDTGIGGSLWTGYDFWISDQWSLGAEARAVGVSAKRQFSDNVTSGSLFSSSFSGINGTLDDRGSSFELLFTALYH